MSDESNTAKLRTTELLATAAAIASATTAMGESIRFENTANFTWDFALLDLTLASDAQVFGTAADATGSSIYLDYFGDFYPSFSYSHTYTSGNGAEIFNSGFSDRYAKPLAFGEMIGPGLADGSFSASSTIDFVWSSYDYYTGYSDSGNRGLLPAHEDVYLGVRLELEGLTHYGWIGVNRSGAYVDVFAWGYETEAGVAVGAGVPAPGALGVLAVGAVGALKRKRVV
ncbi:MAG: hypothetical protein P1U30_06030 [Phycisphaerales bacterium]|nr:hypothetical protein [Phycisphaerales bacterium]